MPEAEGVISGFVERNEEALRAPDDAYITSRHLPFRYERQDAEGLLDLPKGVVNSSLEIVE